MPGLFDCCGDRTLVPGAGARLAARADLAIFGDVLAQQVGLFVIDHQGLICTKLTEFGLGKEAAFAAAFWPGRCSSFFHLVLQFCFYSLENLIFETFLLRTEIRPRWGQYR